MNVSTWHSLNKLNHHPTFDHPHSNSNKEYNSQKSDKKKTFESYFRHQWATVGLPVVFIIDIQPKRVHSQPQLWSFLVLNVKVVNPVHFKILSNLQVPHHGIFSTVWRNLMNYKTHMCLKNIKSFLKENYNTSSFLCAPDAKIGFFPPIHSYWGYAAPKPWR